MFLKFLLLALVFSGNNAKPSQTVYKKNVTSGPLNNDKKGTIRIAGPWHSDSALDRNIDPGEDSYVKKIISSNEGINFNKDIAEAGEVFDVNGIEDFYDKNAMITYEVNGHEIPVHMKPKYTPQSKSMFPEYMKESPATIGMTRQAKNNLLQMQRLSEKPDRGPSTFTGLSVKDMPEYTVHESPDVPNNHPKVMSNNQKHNDLTQVLDSNVLKIKPREALNPTDTPQITSNQMPSTSTNANFFALSNQLNKQTKNIPDISSIDNNEQFSRDLMLKQRKISELMQTISKLRAKQKLEAETSPSSLIAESSLQTQLKSNEVSPQSTILSLKNIPTSKDQSIDTNHRLLDETKDLTSSNPRYNEGKLLLPDLLMKNLAKESSNQDELLKETGQIKTTAPTHTIPSTTTEKQNLQIPNIESDVEPAKAKAKEKILNLLGELTSKLKGMEAAVTGDHKRENNVDKKENTSELGHPFVENETKVAFDSDYSEKLKPLPLTATFKNTETIPHERPDFVDSPTIPLPKIKQNHTLLSSLSSNLGLLSRLGGAKIDFSKLTLQNLDEINSKLLASSNIVKDINRDSEEMDNEISRRKKKENMEVFEQSPNSSIQSAERVKLITPDEKLIAPVDDSATHNKNLPEIIEKYKEKNTPFIMNTESIDYKPSFPLGIISNQKHREDLLDKAEKDDYISNVVNTKSEFSPTKLERLMPAEAIASFSKVKPVTKLVDENENDGPEDDGEDFLHGRNPVIDNIDHRRGFSHFREKENKVEHKTFEDGQVNGKIFEVDESDSFNTAGNRDKVVHRSFHAKNEEENDYPDYNEVKDASIFEINLLRKRYHANKLVWSDRLSDEAQKQAELLARKIDIDETKLDSKKLPGENIALIKLSSPNVGKDAPDIWEKESKNYDFRSPLVSKRNSNFVQLMWKATSEFGLGVAKSKSGKGWIVVSFFDAPYVDKFQDLKSNLESDIPIDDPYQDIAG